MIETSVGKSTAGFPKEWEGATDESKALLVDRIERLTAEAENRPGDVAAEREIWLLIVACNAQEANHLVQDLRANLKSLIAYEQIAGADVKDRIRSDHALDRVWNHYKEIRESKVCSGMTP